MFSDTLKKQLDTLPPAFTAKQAEEQYWKTPTAQIGRTLKFAATVANPAQLEAIGNAEGTKEALRKAEKDVEEAHKGIDKMTDALSRLCLETGVDPEQGLDDVIDSLVGMLTDADNGDGEKVDDAPDPDGDPNDVEKGGGASTDAPASDARKRSSSGRFESTD